ncbi:MAG: winged helix-turn-helix domain-containing protein [Candidatus Aminicenantes bacterium]|nr:MAG: winged helix-turn-helix domain-containing protein [Candidatus Aminicenantes bacterium]
MEIAGGFEVIVFDKVKEDQPGKKETVKITQPTTLITTQNTTQKILELIEYNPKITRKEMAREIGISEDGIKYNLDKLTTPPAARGAGTLLGGCFLKKLPREASGPMKHPQKLFIIDCLHHLGESS